MITDGQGLMVAILAQIFLGMVVYRIIIKAGFTTKSARYAHLIPILFVIDYLISATEIRKSGLFSGQYSFGVVFDLFSLIVPFTAPALLCILYLRKWPAANDNAPVG